MPIRQYFITDPANHQTRAAVPYQAQYQFLSQAKEQPAHSRQAPRGVRLFFKKLTALFTIAAFFVSASSSALAQSYVPAKEQARARHKEGRAVRKDIGKKQPTKAQRARQAAAYKASKNSSAPASAGKDAGSEKAAKSAGSPVQEEIASNAAATKMAPPMAPPREIPAYEASPAYGMGNRQIMFAPPQWAGFYIGVAGSYSFAQDQEIISAFAESHDKAEIKRKLAGQTASLYSGVNIGSGSLLFGWEAEWPFMQPSVIKQEYYPEKERDNGSFIEKFSVNKARDGIDKIVSNLNEKVINALFTVLMRLRVSYDLGDFLPYIAIGTAARRVEIVEVTGPVSKPVPGEGRARMQPGYAVSIGVEYAITRNLFFRSQYRYDNFGSMTYKIGPGRAAAGVNPSYEATNHNASIGIAYKF